MSTGWNPWHGCHKFSEGCMLCYVYRGDKKYDRDSSIVSKTASFTLPLKRKRDKTYKIPPGEHVYTCFSSDFLVEDADAWRAEAWAIIRERSDLHFEFFTKRILRLEQLLPDDWGDGYDHVTIGCTVENQKRADERLSVFLSLPIRHRVIVCSPLLTDIDFRGSLAGGIEGLYLGGESGAGARVCRYDWVLNIRRQCIDARVPFHYHQTGARLLKDGKIYRIPRHLQGSQARKAGIDVRSFPAQ